MASSLLQLFTNFDTRVTTIPRNLRILNVRPQQIGESVNSTTKRPERVSSFSTLSRPASSFSTLDYGENRLPLEFTSLYGAAAFFNIWQRPCTCSSPEADMFRISTIDSPRERRLVVEGTLVQPWVAELRKTWSEAGNSLEGRNLVIDLSNVTTIGGEGKAAIFELMKEGAKFSCNDVLTKHVLKQLAHRCHARLHDVLTARCSRSEETRSRRTE